MIAVGGPVVLDGIPVVLGRETGKLLVARRKTVVGYQKDCYLHLLLGSYEDYNQTVNDRLGTWMEKGKGKGKGRGKGRKGQERRKRGMVGIGKGDWTAVGSWMTRWRSGEARKRRKGREKLGQGRLGQTPGRKYWWRY